MALSPVDHYPRFTQAPVSYIEMEPLHDVYLNTDIEIDFRPETANGMLSVHVCAPCS